MKILDTTFIRNDGAESMLLKIKNSAGNQKVYFRRGSFTNEIIWGSRKFVFPTKKKANLNNAWIFRIVYNDVEEYCMNRNIKAKQHLPAVLWNDESKLKKIKSKMTGTDLDHAYWRIAYLNNIISEKTYQKGLLIKDKSMRLAALANLSSSKEYKIVVDGEITDKSIILKFEPKFQRLYNNIRYECFEHMNNLAQMLGDDFVCYRTDCIYYKDTKKNRNLVYTYLDSVAINYKQLVDIALPEEKEEPESTNLLTL